MYTHPIFFLRMNHNPTRINATNTRQHITGAAIHALLGSEIH